MSLFRNNYVLGMSIKNSFFRDFPGGRVFKTLQLPTQGAGDSIPGQGTKIPYAAWRSQKKKFLQSFGNLKL